MTKTLLTVAALLVLPTIANANYYCTGNVGNLMLSKNGTVTASLSGSFTSVYLCQIGATYNGVSSDLCRSIHAQLLGASLAGRQVRFYFSDDSSGGTCSSHASWTNLTGWYSGPELVP